MELFSPPDNPAPPGEILATLTTSDGLSLRSVRWATSAAGRGTIVLAGGRGEFIEKYFEVIGELLARGLDVVTFDWRGQGLSSRELSNPRKGHIDDFLMYGRDMDAVTLQVLKPFCPKPWFGLGHSMGGAIFLMDARLGHSVFERMVLSTPMIALAGLRYPRGAKWLATGLDMIGLGGSFVPGGGETSYITRPFADNVLTSDPVRYARFGDLASKAPQLALGAPTIGWLSAAFRLMGQFEQEDYARRITVPTLIIAAGRDRVVDSASAERFGLSLKGGRTVTIPQAEHEILMERDKFREQFWAAFDAFIPGTRG